MLAILGGTGNLGYGLARRWMLSGVEVIIGSRTADKAEAAAAELRKLAAARGNPTARISGTDNVSAAQLADIVALTVPFSHQVAILTQTKTALQGKILIDTTVPLVPPRVAKVQLPAAGSAALIAQQLLGDGVRVVSAFQNVAADLLRSDDSLDCDVLVCGNNKDAREQVVKLAVAAGMRGFHAGSLDNAVAAEALTSVLIFINKYYDGHAGIRLTGVAGKES
jgi:NADPH-dependent F420 reductase